jgi:hypothetical protein
VQAELARLAAQLAVKDTELAESPPGLRAQGHLPRAGQRHRCQDIEGLILAKTNIRTSMH